MERFIMDWAGNYAFFVPLGVGFNVVLSGWSLEIIQGYALASIPVTAIGGGLFTFFLGKFWYPLFKEKF